MKPQVAVSNEIKIDKGVPMPSARRSVKRYPFAQLEIGDSFFIPGKATGTFGGCLSMHRPKKFSCRTVTENGVKGVRVWRIA